MHACIVKCIIGYVRMNTSYYFCNAIKFAILTMLILILMMHWLTYYYYYSESETEREREREGRLADLIFLLVLPLSTLYAYGWRQPPEQTYITFMHAYIYQPTDVQLWNNSVKIVENYKTIIFSFFFCLWKNEKKAMRQRKRANEWEKVRVRVRVNCYLPFMTIFV